MEEVKKEMKLDEILDGDCLLVDGLDHLLVERIVGDLGIAGCVYMIVRQVNGQKRALAKARKDAFIPAMFLKEGDKIKIVAGFLDIGHYFNREAKYLEITKIYVYDFSGLEF